MKVQPFRQMTDAGLAVARRPELETSPESRLDAAIQACLAAIARDLCGRLPLHTDLTQEVRAPR